jgi:hypothetical protein
MANGNGTVTHLFPNAGKTPTQAQMQKGDKVRAQVTVGTNGQPVSVIHNMQFDTDAPIEDLQTPLVVANLVSGNSAPVVGVVDGNTVSVGGAPGSVYDVWIMRHVGSKVATGEPALPKK